MQQELVPVTQNSAPATVEYTTAQREIIRKTVAANTDDAEFGLFLEVCRSTGLNPFAKQIYAIKRGAKLTIQTGIDGYRVLAERTGKYAGQVGPFWCGADGEWKDAWLSATPPVACKVGVLRRDFAEPLWAVARTAAYTQQNNGLWTTMPDVMIAKCAEALALRKAFPEHISGVYTAEEMAQADNPDITPASYVEAASAPTQREWDAFKDADVTKALRIMGYQRNNEQHDFLVALRDQAASEGQPWVKDAVMAALRASYARTLASQKAAAAQAFPIDAHTAPADLATLPVGERGQ